MANKTCGHPSCNCPVEQGQKFCSDACRDLAATNSRETRCGCDHPDCAAKT